MFGGDRLSATTHDIDEIDEKEGLKGGKDYNILYVSSRVSSPGLRN